MSDYCEFCHTDCDGYVKPLEKNSHAYLYPILGTWKLCVRLKGSSRVCDINFCPMCGRNLMEVEHETD